MPRLILLFLAHLVLVAPPRLFARDLTPDLATRRPRVRLASLPFPGLFYHEAPNGEFGTHHYIPFQKMDPRTRGSRFEVSRGMVYTKRAGFIDLAHLRKTIDWTAYIAHHVREKLRRGESQWKVRFYEPTLFYLRFRYPEGWNQLPAETKAHLLDELAIQIAQEVTYVSLTWHEIITWYGYGATLLFSEKASAFTVDDVVAHALGVRIAGAAIRNPHLPYNQAVTHTLESELRALGRVSRAQAREALEQVKGNWWTWNRSRKRFLDVGYPQGKVEPWLVRDLSFDPAPEPRIFTVPSLRNVAGQDCREMLDIRIQPRVLQSNKVHQWLPERENPIHPEEDFPIILDGIRTEMKKKYGPQALLPYADPPFTCGKN